MCPLWPAHLILLYALLLGPLWLAFFGAIGSGAQVLSPFQVSYEPKMIQQLTENKNETVKIAFNRTNILKEFASYGVQPDEIMIEFIIEDSNIATVLPIQIPLMESKLLLQNYTGLEKDTILVNVMAHYLGYTEICPKSVAINPIDSNNNSVHEIKSDKCLDVSVIREYRVIDTIFTASVATLVTILYVNMGAALDLQNLRDTIRRPYGPTIGFCTQFIIMPVLAYCLAKLLIPKPELQLGLFITGCSPGGGASNIWTLTLGGNLNLSIAMTTISTFSAFAMMPLWILTLGSTLFDQANLTIPYRNIGTLAVALILPLGLGVIIQLKAPKVAQFLVKCLKPLSVCLIIFIIVFATVTNLYLFKLFSWRILLVGMLLPWMGYILGGGTAWLLRQDWRDVIAIGIETGVQNTGLAILALRFSLPQPGADLTTVLPVACSLMTPILPIALMIYQKVTGTAKPKQGYIVEEQRTIKNGLIDRQ